MKEVLLNAVRKFKIYVGDAIQLCEGEELHTEVMQQLVVQRDAAHTSLRTRPIKREACHFTIPLQRLTSLLLPYPGLRVINIPFALNERRRFPSALPMYPYA